MGFAPSDETEVKFVCTKDMGHGAGVHGIMCVLRTREDFGQVVVLSPV